MNNFRLCEILENFSQPSACYINKIFLPILIFVFSSCSGGNRLPAQDVVVDDIGYRPADPKVAFVSGSVASADSFVVVNTKTSSSAYRHKINISKRKDPATGERVHSLNFTEFDEPGTYRISIPGTSYQSVEFQIAGDVYNKVVKKTAESFYYQRCGTEVDIGTQWSHAACHLDDAVFYSDPGKHMDVTGGWHDAGDYGKFSVNTSVSLAFLLYLYDDKPNAFSDGQFDIPQNSNGIPDLLDQSKWALDWLMKMQRSDGAVYHKVQKKKWTGEYLPQNDPDTRYIYEVSSTATGDFAAVTALGSRLFKSVDPEFSSQLTEASQKAWSFLAQHPDMVPEGGFKNPEGVKGGEYGDHKDSDERLWAAVELYRLTGADKYHKYFLNNYRSLGGPRSPSVSWKNVGELAYYSYLDIPQSKYNGQAFQFISQKLTTYADKLVRRISQNGYRMVLKKNEYYWGSNAVALGYAFDLVQAYELTDGKLYREAALDQLHYILGRNPFGRTFVTGVGDRPVQHPYHQFSIEKDGPPVPGMVVGGPNSKNHLHDEPLSKYPAKNYEDNEKNYMVNETAINYTAPLVYLSGYFSEFGAESVSLQTQ